MNSPEFFIHSGFCFIEMSKCGTNQKLYSEYADTTLLFIFREKKSDVYDYYEVRYGKNNFMHLAGIKSKTLSIVDFYTACEKQIIKGRLQSTKKCKYYVCKNSCYGTNVGFEK